LPVHGVVRGDGDVYGTLEHLTARDFKASYLDHTFMEFDLDLQGVRDVENAIIEIQTHNSSIAPRELKRLLPSITLPQFFDKINRFRVNGAMTGGFFKFLVDANITSNLGSIITSLQVGLPPKVDVISYKGYVSTRGLNLNQLELVEENPSSNLNFTGSVNGVGSNLEDMRVQFDALIYKSDLLGFYVDSMEANVLLSDHTIKGTIEGSDHEGSADLTIDLDLSTSPAVYKLDGLVKNLNLYTYKLYKDPIQITSKMHIDLKGDSLEDIVGELKLEEASLYREKDSSTIQVPNLYFQALNDESIGRYFNLKSSLVDADISGDFTINKSLQLLKRLGYESQLYFANDDSLINAYYAEKKQDSSEIFITFGIGVKDSINQIFDFLDLPIYISDGTLAIGKLGFGPKEQAVLEFDFDSIQYENFFLRGGDLDLRLVKERDQNQLAVSGGIYLDSLRASSKFVLDSVWFDVDGQGNIFKSTLKAKQSELENYAHLEMTARLFPESKIEFAIDDSVSKIKVQGETLTVTENNSIIYNQKELDIRNFQLYDDLRYIRIDGVASENPSSKLTVNIGQIRLGIISDFLSLPLQPTGKLNANIYVHEILGNARLEVENSRIDDFALDEYHYGDISFQGKWEKEIGSISMNASLADTIFYSPDSFVIDNTLFLSGSYQVNDTVSPLFMQIFSHGEKGFPLDYIYPFVKTQLYGIGGFVKLESFNVSGNFQDLNVSGVGNFEDAGFGVDYFQTEYVFDGAIKFNNDQIVFPRITLYDKYQNHADFHGLIRHRGMREFDFNLQLDKVQNFLIMNTRKEHNSLFYGEMYIKEGIADITGDLSKLKVQAIASAGPRSHLRLPVNYEDDLGRPDFISFVDHNLNKKEKGTVETGLQGFELNLTAIATEDLQIDLIFDEKVGDIMKGKGDGVITLKVTQDGEFTMFGEYEVKQGEYLFTAQNILNKKFEVKPGGTINWTGDPFGAVLDLEAIYPLNADIKDLIQEDYSVRVPVNVLMHLTGLLLEPEIGLAIELPNINQQNVSQVASYIKNIQYDEQELNKQVFSLMVFKRFAPTGGFLGDGIASAGSGVTSSVSELLSNQLNYWLSQVMSDKISVNVNTTNFQDVNLLVSAKLFNDRVTVERDGSLVGTNSSLALGNISLIIKLLPSVAQEENGDDRSRELVLEVFNRETVNISQQNSTNKAGIGLFFKKDFDKLKDLFSKPVKTKSVESDTISASDRKNDT
ncbi:MAG: translocation/assembly module TamB domain-containing protein, partial [Bacteroidetes bacterium]|nr:translocation/assembly module TamB domain-containing protein [Bacteroidota bacterium]